MPSPQPEISRTRRTVTDPADFAGVVSGMDLTVRYRTRQARPSVVSQCVARGFAFDFGELHVKSHIRGALPGDCASICIIRGPGKVVFNGLTGEKGTLFYLPPGAEIDGCSEADMRWATISIPAATWEQCGAATGMSPEEVRHQPGWRLDPESAGRIVGRLDQIERMLFPDGSDEPVSLGAVESARAFAGGCAELAWELASQPDGRRDSVRNRTRLAKRAHEWMVEHIAEEFGISGLCVALGTSRRELEYAFRTTLDTSPLEHLNVLRLNAIRQAIRRADPSVRSIAEIAVLHGVKHLGRFAAGYRRIFGELPGETWRARTAPRGR